MWCYSRHRRRRYLKRFWHSSKQPPRPIATPPPLQTAATTKDVVRANMALIEKGPLKHQIMEAANPSPAESLRGPHNRTMASTTKHAQMWRQPDGRKFRSQVVEFVAGHGQQSKLSVASKRSQGPFGAGAAPPGPKPRPTDEPTGSDRCFHSWLLSSGPRTLTPRYRLAVSRRRSC